MVLEHKAFAKFIYKSQQNLCPVNKIGDESPTEFVEANEDGFTYTPLFNIFIPPVPSIVYVELVFVDETLCFI